MTNKIRWGILSTGGIAGKMADALNQLEDAELIAVGSRSQASADAFGDRFNIPRRYPTYEAFVQDPDIDVIYIGTPHSFHHRDGLLCLNHGKAVLCEKAFTMTGDEAAELINVAREKKLFLMEAMWTRFLPHIVKTRELIREGVLGEIRHLNADFGFRAEFDPKHRLFAPELGGGALHDVGIYPVSFASMVLGKPDVVYSLTKLGQTGVDEETAMLFGYGENRTAQLFASTRLNTMIDAAISGTEAMIYLHSRFFAGDTLSIIREERSQPREIETITVPTNPNGFVYQAQEVMDCLRAGKLESEIMPLDETLAIMRTLDTISAQWG